MHLYDEIRTLAAAIAAPDLLKRMGYPAPRAEQVTRLRHVLNDPNMGLAYAGYDLVHDSPSFLLALSAAVGLDLEASALRIGDIAQQLRAQAATIAPWLYVQSEHADALARDLDRQGCWGLSVVRKLPLPADMRGRPLEDSIASAAAEIRRHMAETGGVLPGWIPIDGYLLIHDARGPALSMTTTGLVDGALLVSHLHPG